MLLIHSIQLTRVDMSLKLQFCFLVLFVHESTSVWQRKTVTVGETLTLTCAINAGDTSNVEWKNPSGFVMFFNHNKALKDSRYSIVNFSKKEFKVAVSDVNFRDGGVYTCLHYHHKHKNVATKRVKVIVLGTPKLEVTKNRKETTIKCSAEGNAHPPKLSWQFGNGLEILAQSNSVFDHKTRKHSSEASLHIKSGTKSVTVKCLVRHPALRGPNLIDSVEIKLDTNEVPHTMRPSTERVTNTPVEKLTEKTTFYWPVTEGSTETPSDKSTYSTKIPKVTEWPTPEGPPTAFTGSYISTHSHPDTTQPESTVFTSQNDTSSYSTTMKGFLPASETMQNTFPNKTGGNTSIERGFDGVNRQTGKEGSTPLLVLLVTCLIFGLLVVVTFFGIRLRRAHIIWKKENEDSNQSVNSTKSKSSHEEKHTQNRRHRGLFNIGFTKYSVEPTDVAAASPVTTTATRDKTEETPESYAKETEL
ncbi:cytotoxic and regulatory T-cell molecule isoform X1 [Hypomesus transpacificus]|uniref:cytotoxic and regulatory T-cell molecule isoform X1 n=1 Tax=Hypomesus transpacificus TaxID=137520 RepID=UPI001F07B26B|nr:cytotoxic and regulatory T-cell molecule isoform X1 [Hypomesus transpacificus]